MRSIRQSVAIPLCQPGLRRLPLTITDLRAGMESFPEMTNRVTTLVRATGIEDLVG